MLECGRGQVGSLRSVCLTVRPLQRNKVIPDFVESLVSAKTRHTRNLCTLMHERGINLRYLGLVLQLVSAANTTATFVVLMHVRAAQRAVCVLVCRHAGGDGGARRKERNSRYAAGEDELDRRPWRRGECAPGHIHGHSSVAHPTTVVSARGCQLFEPTVWMLSTVGWCKRDCVASAGRSSLSQNLPLLFFSVRPCCSTGRMSCWICYA